MFYLTVGVTLDFLITVPFDFFFFPFKNSVIVLFILRAYFLQKLVEFSSIFVSCFSGLFHIAIALLLLEAENVAAGQRHDL